MRGEQGQGWELYHTTSGLARDKFVWPFVMVCSHPLRIYRNTEARMWRMQHGDNTEATLEVSFGSLLSEVYVPWLERVHEYEAAS